MQFVVDSVKTICKAISKTVKLICNGIKAVPDAGCFYCCKYFGKMTDGLGSMIGSCFKTPFSCCASLSLLIIIAPLIWGMIGYIDGSNINCKQPVQIGLLITSTFGDFVYLIVGAHAINFLFIIYLIARYGKKKKKKILKLNSQTENADATQDVSKIQDQKDVNESQKRKKSTDNRPVQTEANEEVNKSDVSIAVEEDPKEYESILVKSAKIVSKDKVVWAYVIFLMLVIVWLVICHYWRDSVPAGSKCLVEAKGKNLLSALVMAVFFMWLYIFGGIFIALYTVIIRACQEGSCLPWDVNRAFILCITCSRYDIKTASATGQINFETQKERFTENLKEYSEGRAKWIEKSFNLLNNLGLGGRPVKVKQIEEKKAVEDPHGIEVTIKTFDQINNLNTTNAYLNQSHLQTEMIQASPNMPKISRSMSNRMDPKLGIPTIKAFDKV